MLQKLKSHVQAKSHLLCQSPRKTYILRIEFKFYVNHCLTFCSTSWILLQGKERSMVQLEMIPLFKTEEITSLNYF